MVDKPYDVFISYRRDGGSALAQVIRNALASRGYNVFLDVRELRSGRFDEALKKTIASTPDFLLLLTSKSLDRCVNTDDWVLQEILHAFQTNRNVVLLRSEDFVIPTTEQLPSSISKLSGHNCVTYVHEHSDAAIERVALMLRSNVRLQRKRRFTQFGVMAAAVVMLGGAIWLWAKRPPPPVPVPNRDGHVTPPPASVAVVESDESKFVGAWEMTPQWTDSITVKMTTRIDKDMTYRGTCSIEETGNIVFDANKVCYYVPTGHPARIVAGQLGKDTMRVVNLIPNAFWGFVTVAAGSPPPFNSDGDVWTLHRISQDGFDVRWDLDLPISGMTWKMNLFTSPKGPYRFVAFSEETGQYVAKEGKFKIISKTGNITEGEYQFVDKDSYTGKARWAAKPVLWKRVR